MSEPGSTELENREPQATHFVVPHADRGPESVVDDAHLAVVLLQGHTHNAVTNMQVVEQIAEL